MAEYNKIYNIMNIIVILSGGVTGLMVWDIESSKDI